MTIIAKRRDNGKGSIQKRADSHWEGRCTAGRDPKTGKAISKNVLCKTLVEVKDKLKAAIEKNKTSDVKAGNCTVEQWLNAWMENYAKL